MKILKWLIFVLQIYLDQLNRAEYVRSYKQAGQDISVMQLAEEGINEYFARLEDEDAAG